MPMLLRHLLRLGLAAAFFVAATVQLFPSNMAVATVSVQTDMGAGCDQPKPPGPDHSPSCVDNFGCCLSVPPLPIAPTSLAVPYRWATVTYDFVTAPLLGRSIKPELLPPILFA